MNNKPFPFAVWPNTALVRAIEPIDPITRTGGRRTPVYRPEKPKRGTQPPHDPATAANIDHEGSGSLIDVKAAAFQKGGLRWDNPIDYTDRDNTELSPNEESLFQLHARHFPALRDSSDYDSRGWWKEQMQGMGRKAYRSMISDPSGQAASSLDWMGTRIPRADDENSGHFTDTHKKRNHPTFSTGSKFHSEETPGGLWEKTGRQNSQGNDQWSFTPSDFNLQMHSPESLREYWDSVEAPNEHILKMPQS